MIDLVCLVTLHFTFFYWKPKFLFSTHLSRITCLRIQWAGQRKGLKSWRFGDIPGPLLGLRALLHAAQGRSAFRGREALPSAKEHLKPSLQGSGPAPRCLCGRPVRDQARMPRVSLVGQASHSEDEVLTKCSPGGLRLSLRLWCTFSGIRRRFPVVGRRWGREVILSKFQMVESSCTI